MALDKEDDDTIDCYKVDKYFIVAEGNYIKNITNNLNRYDIFITTTKNGKFVDEKCVTIDLEPGQTYKLPYDVVEKRYKDEEYIVTFTVKEKNETVCKKYSCKVR